jgi:hypothetical protein
VSTIGVVDQPSDPERARAIVASATLGSLSTIAHRPAGYPFGSVVSYAVDDAGRPLLALSDLAEHAKNIARDVRASLLVAEDGPPGVDRLAVGRVTLIGDAVMLDGGEREDAAARYLQVHPGARWIEFGDFRLYRLDPVDVRYVGGFGRMSWVKAGAYASAEPDPLLVHAADICEHMNTDHADAVVVYAKAFTDAGGAATVRMTGVDRYGFDLLADGERVRLAFAREVTTPDEARVELIRLLTEARRVPAPAEDERSAQ